MLYYFKVIVYVRKIIK